MKKRIAWLVVSGLMVLALIVTSCAPAVTKEKEVVTEKKEVVTEEKEVVTEKEVVVEKGADMVTDALGRLVPKPQYGGTINTYEMSDITSSFTRSDMNRTGGWGKVSNGTSPGFETLLTKNRLNGPSGTGEVLMDQMSAQPGLEFIAPRLAESWEIIQPDTVKFKIRKGIHWQDGYPAYGAELTAQDIVFDLWTHYAGKWGPFNAKGSYYWPINHVDKNYTNPERAAYVDPADKWTVVTVTWPGNIGMVWEQMSLMYNVNPSTYLGAIDGEGWGEVWKGVGGTGPFRIKDYVKGSVLTWEKNPSYWKTDVFYPEQQYRLPYFDRLNVFIIPDVSTVVAAIRTGKLDMVANIEQEDWEALMKSNPDLQYRSNWRTSAFLAFRNDKAPWDNMRVRQAMHMAIDHDDLVNNYFEGYAMKFYFPWWPVPDFDTIRIPLEEMPEIVQLMYGYHLDKARQILAEEGYPDGFTTTVMLSSADEKTTDLITVIAAYWAKVGVTLNLDVKEPAVFSSADRTNTYTGIATTGGVFHSDYVKWNIVRPGHGANNALVDQPWTNELYTKAMEIYPEDRAGVLKIAKDATPRLHESAFFFLLPIIPSYSMWQPWVKGWAGELRPEHHSGSTWQTSAVVRYIWIDSVLKKSLGR